MKGVNSLTALTLFSKLCAISAAAAAAEESDILLGVVAARVTEKSVGSLEEEDRAGVVFVAWCGRVE
jgi:hypothetical protein